MIFIATATAELPAGFYMAMNEMGTLNTMCVKNYQSGVAFTETYDNFEHLEKDTTVVTPSLSTNPFGANQSALVANVNSNVIGHARLTWESFDANLNFKGRHNPRGTNTEDLTGVFSINKLIQLYSNATYGSDVEWLPCA